jgi:hypothetical protein
MLAGLFKRTSSRIKEFGGALAVALGVTNWLLTKIDGGSTDAALAILEGNNPAMAVMHKRYLDALHITPRLRGSPVPSCTDAPSDSSWFKGLCSSTVLNRRFVDCAGRCIYLDEADSLTSSERDEIKETIAGPEIPCDVFRESRLDVLRSLKK